MPKILDRLIKQLEDKGIKNSYPIAIASLQKSGNLKKGTKSATAKGAKRGSITPAERATTQATNNYGTRNQNYTTTSTSRLNNNISIIKSYVHIVGEGTIIPHFRSENTGNVTLLNGTHIKCKKI